MRQIEEVPNDGWVIGGLLSLHSTDRIFGLDAHEPIGHVYWPPNCLVPRKNASELLPARAR
jgi:hypothetical protein